MSPFELKIKLDLAEDRAQFVKKHSVSDEMNVIVTDDGNMHFFDDDGNDITKSTICIKNWAFYYCTSLKSVVIPDSVKSIGHQAFSWCKNLASISIPDSVIGIREDAFSYCSSLESIVIPDSIKRIGRCAFIRCSSLTSIIFKGKTLEEVKSMDSYPWGVEDESAFKAENKA